MGQFILALAALEASRGPQGVKLTRDDVKALFLKAIDGRHFYYHTDEEA
jgi:hypothetical protein